MSAAAIPRRAGHRGRCAAARGVDAVAGRRSARWPLAVLVCLVVPAERTAAAATGDPVTDAAAIERLIRQLGDGEFAVREAAAGRLAGLGAAAADALLAAADSSADLEVALGARRLVDALPLADPADPPAVRAILDRYPQVALEERVQLMHRLLRLDDDAGVAPLARIVRQERSNAGSRIAAALLVREWGPGDEAWPTLAPRIAAGIGPGGRPAARLLRALLAEAPSTVDADEAVAALRLVERPGDAAPADSDAGSAVSEGATNRIFRRAVTELLACVGRRDEALGEAKALFDACRGSPAEEELLATELAWLTDHGLPEAAVHLADRADPDAGSFSPVVAWAVAAARRRGGDEAGAALVADLAAAASADDGGRRLQAAMLLARWGAADWSLREYRGVVDHPGSTGEDRGLAGILAAELLHDLGRDDEAAAMLRPILDDRDADAEQILPRLERDPRTVRSRMLYFAACAAHGRGDQAARRRLLEESLATNPSDVDALIAWYRLDDSPSHRADAARRVARAAEEIDAGVQSTPDDPNPYNEYAWLVANTEGDAARAVRYSRKSLELSFDTGSYLDTLAHCRAAAGDAVAAFRTQLLAARREPHNATIRRSLERFRAALGGGPP